MNKKYKEKEEEKTSFTLHLGIEYTQKKEAANKANINGEHEHISYSLTSISSYLSDHFIMSPQDN